MELSVKLLAALPASAATASDQPFRPSFSIQVQLLSPDGTMHVQRTKEFSLKKGGAGGGGGGGGSRATGASRPRPLGHQTLTFTLPSSSTRSPCGSSIASRLGSPASSFTAGSDSCSYEQQGAAQRAATELRFGILGKLSDMTTDVLMAQGSTTLANLPADGQPHPAAIKMKRWCGANAGQPAGELAVELRLRPRRSSRRGGLARCPSGASSEAGLLSRSASCSSRSGSCCSGSLSHTASLPGEDKRRPLLCRLLAALQPACACTQVAPM